jgi:hypothetical protein
MTTPQWGNSPTNSRGTEVTPRPASLQSGDYFKPLKDMNVKRGIKVGAYGSPETGKSYFGMTCPEPIYVIDSELAAVKLAKQHFAQKDIRVCEVKVISEETMQPDAIASMYEFENAIVSLKDIKSGTILVDNVTDYWQYVCAYMEENATRRTKSGQPLRFEYAMANERYKYFIMRLLTSPASVVLVAQSQKAYDSEGKETSVSTARWQKQTPFWVDIVLHFDKNMIQGGQIVHEATMEKCRLQRAMNLKIKDCTYDKLVAELKDKLSVSINLV